MDLEVSNLKKNFGEKVVLDDISFSCKAGRATGLLGRNGAGKTTSIRIILGIISKDSGEVTLGGGPFPAYYNGVGYLPEERGLYPKIKVGEQLIYFAMLRGMNKKDAKKSLDQWLGRLDMKEYENKNFETLSKGNQQKAQFMAALLHNPHIVILDEPFSGLDPVNAQLLKDVVQELISGGKTVIFSSHQMNYVEEFCDEIMILHSGHIVLNGSLSKIKRGFERKKLFVRLREPGADIAASFNLPGVNGIEPYNDGYLLRLGSEAVSFKVLKTIHEKNHDIDKFDLMEHSLNDIFIMKTQEEDVSGGVE